MVSFLFLSIISSSSTMTDWDKLNPPLQPSQVLIKRKNNQNDLTSTSLQVQKKRRTNQPALKVKREDRVKREGRVEDEDDFQDGKSFFLTDIYLSSALIGLPEY